MTTTSTHHTFSLWAPIDDTLQHKVLFQPPLLIFGRKFFSILLLLTITLIAIYSLCWEQNVHVIVMLTREVEGAMVKCGSYWTENAFGPLRLRLISTNGLLPEDDQSGFFASSSTSSKFTPDSSRIKREHRHKSETIKRVFELVHTGHPAAKPRTVVHLQYLEWPDMNVPDDPRGVLGLIKQVQEAIEETNIQDEPTFHTNTVDMSTIELDETVGIAKHALGKNSPVLLHCSAGVGRTGGFIAVDAVLDAIRREIRTKITAHRSSEAMDIDPPIFESARVEENGNSHSSLATISIAVTSGHPLLPTQLDGSAKEEKGSLMVSSGLAVHVPEASSILHPRELQYENSLLAADTCTRKWVENVAQYGRTVTTGSSSSEGSEGLQHAHGSYHHSSSSLDTSVSGSSSFSKSLFPPAGIQNIPTTLPDYLPTFSKRSEDHSRNVSVNATSLAPTSKVFKPGPSATGGQSMPNLLGKLSDTLPVPIDHHSASDVELPSRSQSPSADEESRQDDGRQLQNSHSRPIDSACTAPFTSPDSEHKSFDYKEPRRLHEDYSPLALTTFDDPIWEVVQDMREQRMSLCQSLRQYVFVHAAIIEGALMVLDQEKESTQPKIQQASTLTPDSVYGSEDAFMASSVSIGKRGASPTELLKEGKTGKVLEPKRPSIKRKHRSRDDHASDNLRYPSMPNRTISHVVHHGMASLKTFPP
jgi:protein tyrosine phosphatase